MSNYMDRYHAWKDAQVCLGCQRKSCTMEPGEEKWMTEYLCTPCFNRGVRGMPKTMFDGYSGTVYSTTARASGAHDISRPHITKNETGWFLIAHASGVKREWYKPALEHVRKLNRS